MSTKYIHAPSRHFPIKKETIKPDCSEPNPFLPTPINEESCLSIITDEHIEVLNSMMTYMIAHYENGCAIPERTTELFNKLAKLFPMIIFNGKAFRVVESLKDPANGISFSKSFDGINHYCKSSLNFLNLTDSPSLSIYSNIVVGLSLNSLYEVVKIVETKFPIKGSEQFKKDFVAFQKEEEILKIACLSKFTLIETRPKKT